MADYKIDDADAMCHFCRRMLVGGDWLPPPPRVGFREASLYIPPADICPECSVLFAKKGEIDDK